MLLFSVKNLNLFVVLLACILQYDGFKEVFYHEIKLDHKSKDLTCFIQVRIHNGKKVTTKNVVKQQFSNNKINTKTTNYNILNDISCTVNICITLIPVFKHSSCRFYHAVIPSYVTNILCKDKLNSFKSNLFLHDTSKYFLLNSELDFAYISVVAIL
jgi:hypothetical protein